jgi:hypothetical protein
MNLWNLSSFLPFLVSPWTGYYPGNQTLQCWLSVTSDSTLLVYPFLISEDCTLVTVAYISIS